MVDTSSLINITLPVDSQRLANLKQYLDTEYAGWSVVSTEVEHDVERVGIVLKLPGAWVEEDEKAWNELYQEKVILSFRPVSEPVKVEDDEQIILQLIGALRGLVGEDGYLEDECECDNTHARTQTVCRICWARNMLAAYQWAR